jgi:RNA polymerase primary sigma factor
MAGEDSDTSIKLYLREIMRVPLLTPQDEITLAARIKKGDSEARAWMIKANLRLVVKIAHDYANLGLPLLDLISEGNIGLMKAVERFDPAKGGKLSTYGAWWIGSIETKTSPSRGTLCGVDWLNFFLAGVQTGVGPSPAIYLAGYK